MRVRRLSMLIALAPIACGGAAPPPVQNAVVTTMPAVTITATPSWDTSPVAMPANVGLVARVTNVSAAADKLSRWTRIPLSPLDALGNNRAARVVDLGKPVDIVVTIEERGRGKPKPTVAYSAAIRSLDEARAILSEKNELVNGENGALKIVPKKAAKPSQPQDRDGDGSPDVEDENDDDDRKCVLAPAFGPAAWRMVCAETDQALGKILPYMTRGVTRITADQDIHIEAYPAPLRKFLNAAHGEVSRDLARSGPGAQVLADLMAAYDPFELALDLDHATLDAKLGDAAGDASLSLVFREKQSGLTKAFASHPELAGPAPASFLRLPLDSDVAFYTHGFDATELDKARTLGGDALVLGLQGSSNALPPSDAQAIGNAFKNTVGSLSGQLVYARGVDVVQARAALSAFAAAKDDASKAKLGKAAIEQVAGWEIVGLEQPIAKVGPNVKEYATAFARPGIVKWMKEDDSDPTMPVTTFKAGAAIAGLPADSLHFEATFFHAAEVPPPPPASNAKQKPIARAPKPPITTKLHVVVIADQGHTWIVDGMDLPTVTAKAKGLMPGAPDTTTLAKRADIEALRTRSSNAGGFFNIQGIGLDLPIAWANRTPAYELAGDDPLGGMTSPQQGATAVPFMFTETAPPAGMQGVLVLSARVPKEAVTDGISYGSKLF